MATGTAKRSTAGKWSMKEGREHPRRRASRRTPTSLQTLARDLLAIGMRVPPEERSRLPRDFNENLDHYLYGAPRRKPRRS